MPLVYGFNKTTAVVAQSPGHQEREQQQKQLDHQKSASASLSIRQRAMPSANLRLNLPPAVPAEGSAITPTVYEQPAQNRAELIERIKAGGRPAWSFGTGQEQHPADWSNSNDLDSIIPQSHLHSGIFLPENAHSNTPPSPINPHFHPFTRSNNERYPTYTPALEQTRTRTRAQSISNYILKEPTSPLAHSSNSYYDDEFSIDNLSTDPINISTSYRHSRRASLVWTPGASPFSFSPGPSPSPGHTRQPSHPKRTVLDNWYDSQPVAPTQARSSRRSSVGYSAHHEPFGSFVGSYEESILSGRMSTTPSKPLNFIAKIGALGLGDCKSSLKCPTHVTIPFPAYFYAVGDYDSPSPYVGQVDLETALAGNTKSSKGFPDGGYRIPERGQLQIVIKNPNQTAVKLFLVPYDLKDMKAGTKTFIRQKSYSADALSELVQQSPGASKGQRDREREALRYLLHLHICSPSKGRFYLHRVIRVVFANRVPDGKEKLRVEVQQPSPKYSPWKSGKTVTPTEPTTGTDAFQTNPTSARRRRSSSLMLSLAASGLGVSHARHSTRPNRQASIDEVSPTSIAPEEDLFMCESPEKGYGKLSSSIYASSSGGSESGQTQGLLALKLRNLDSLSTEDETMSGI